MNLNVTVEDLRLGHYESQQRLLFKNLVQKRAILNHPGDDIIPTQFVQCELLKLMIENSVGESGIIVVHAERGLGKTTAAKFILKNSAGGVMFCNPQSTSTAGLYWKGVAQSIGIPPDVYEKDHGWETLLVKAVAAAERQDTKEEPSRSSWISQVLDRFTTRCGAQLDPHDDFDPPSIEGYTLPPIKERAVIVFDDFNDVENGDIVFMKHLFPIVEGYGVLAFVLVRDEHTANRLIRLNGWGRIAPLEGMCKDISKGSGEKIPQWVPPRWTRSQLVALVRSRISSNVDLESLEIADGDNPFDVLKRARKILLHS